MDLLVRHIVIKTTFSLLKMVQWGRDEDEWVRLAGGTILASMAMAHNELCVDYFERYFSRIKGSLQRRENRTREAMNNALIGIRNPVLQQKALAATANIGRVPVYHGETACLMPDAYGYKKHGNAKRKKQRALTID